MQKWTLQHCIDYAIKKQGKCLSIDYRNVDYSMIWQCQYNHIWNACFYQIKKGHWCPHCANRVKHGIETCIKFAATKNGKCLSTIYTNAHIKLLWECSEGHQWEATFHKIKNRGHWCHTCGIKKCADSLRYTIQDCQNTAISKSGKCLSTNYNSITNHLQWQCSNGHTWSATFNNIKNHNRWCPHCPNHISKPQKEIYDFLLNTLNIPIILNDTQTIKPMHIDIYLPSLKLAIEYDGEFWHHSDWAIKTGSQIRAAKKNALCKSQGIKLLRIQEKHWAEDKTAQLNEILSFCSS